MGETFAHKVDPAILDEIVRRVVAVARPRKIILFGSAAQEHMSRDSDIDLLVIEDELADEWKEAFRIRQSLDFSRYPVDVFVMSHDRFEQTKNRVGGLAYPANNRGTVVYDASR